MQLTNLLRFDYWLDPSVTDQPAGRAMWLAVIAGVVIIAAVAVLRARGRLPRDAAIAWMTAGALVSAVGLGRLFAVPVLGWRVGWLVAALVALAPLARRLAGHFREDGLAADCIAALAFAPRRNAEWDWHPGTAAVWLAYNLICATVVAVNLDLPAWAAPWLLIVVLAPLLVAFVVRASRGEPILLRDLSALAPLTITYLTALIVALGVRIPGVLNGVLSLPLSAIVMSAYAFAIAARFAASRPPAEDETSGVMRGDLRYVRAGALALIAAALTWSAWAALALRTHGVTGSDPYAYAQMGVDLATRGTVYHPFPLVEVTHDLNIGSYPVTHVGYRIPTDASRQSTTVWPPGYAAFTALAYLIAGEPGLYLVTPLLGLIALAVVAWFSVVITAPIGWPYASGESDEARSVAWAVAALAMLLTATSYQQVEWQMIPMADIAAQLFSLLSIGLALAARGSLARAVLSGLALGIAFDIRYTQVLIAPAVALALWTGARGSRSRPLALIAACAGAAFAAALPVLIYHQVAFGSPLATGSEELGNFSFARLPETLWRTLGELNSYREFGLLTPLIAAGAIALWRGNRRAFLVLATYVAILFGFHVIYAYLRLRDILFLFPVLYLLAALGAVALVRWSIRAPSSTLRQLAAISLICALSFAFVLRAMETVAMPATRGFSAFGYLVREQRASFDRLRALTPGGAVVGTSLNSGAVHLHARRLAFRPATWSPAELTAFVDRLQRDDRPVYVLADGDELAASLQVLRARYALSEVGRLDVPYYQAIGGGSENRSVPLYVVGARRPT